MNKKNEKQKMLKLRHKPKKSLKVDTNYLVMQSKVLPFFES